jgi:hypothetical protein
MRMAGEVVASECWFHDSGRYICMHQKYKFYQADALSGSIVSGCSLFACLTDGPYLSK